MKPHKLSISHMCVIFHTATTCRWRLPPAFSPNISHIMCCFTGGQKQKCCQAYVGGYTEKDDECVCEIV